MSNVKVIHIIFLKKSVIHHMLTRWNLHLTVCNCFCYFKKDYLLLIHMLYTGIFQAETTCRQVFSLHLGSSSFTSVCSSFILWCYTTNNQSSVFVVSGNYWFRYNFFLLIWNYSAKWTQPPFNLLNLVTLGVDNYVRVKMYAKEYHCEIVLSVANWIKNNRLINYKSFERNEQLVFV